MCDPVRHLAVEGLLNFLHNAPSSGCFDKLTSLVDASRESCRQRANFDCIPAPQRSFVRSFPRSAAQHNGCGRYEGCGGMHIRRSSHTRARTENVPRMNLEYRLVVADSQPIKFFAVARRSNDRPTEPITEMRGEARMEG